MGYQPFLDFSAVNVTYRMIEQAEHLMVVMVYV